MHHSSTLLVLLVVLLLVGSPTLAQDAPVRTPEPTGFLDRTITVAGSEHRYVVYVPPHYARHRMWPLIMFLHGMGECGTDGHQQVEVGLGPAIRKAPERWPFVVVFPQKPDAKSQWADHDDLVMAALAATEKEFPINPTRRLLTGLSQGGAGTWALGAKHVDVWSALAPVCGYGKPDAIAPQLKGLPIWAFHGIDDQIVPAQQSKDLCAAIEAAGGDPVLTLYENTAHNSWDQAYRDSDLAEWLRVAGNDLTATVLGLALADPPRAPQIMARMSGLQIVWTTRSSREGECEQQTIRLFSDGASWHVTDVRSRSVRHGATWETVGPPVDRRVPAAEVARCLHDCVRLLVRCGVGDYHHNEAFEGDAVLIDFGTGIGGRSVSAWPKQWPVGDPPSAAVEGLRQVTAHLRKLQ